MYAFIATDTSDICSQYVGRYTPIMTKTDFGIATEDQEKGNHMVDAVYITLTTPSVAFVVCYKHTLDTSMYHIPEELNGKWQLLVLSESVAGVHDGSYVFTPSTADIWYHLPEATTGQYAIIQLLSAGLNFTYSPSSCAASLSGCVGDNLKIVPSGTPCTYDQQNFKHSYLGSTHTNAEGDWDHDGVIGLREGSTPGGVGGFGTQYANPFVDEWSASGLYHVAARDEGLHRNASLVHTKHREEAFVFVRLPNEVGSFEICYSGRTERRGLVMQNSSDIGEIPVWRKLYRCSGSDCTVGGTSFSVVAEPVGWSMLDLSPGTWGDMIFDDSGAGELNVNEAENFVVGSTASGMKHPTAHSSAENYWNPTGGDYFKIVSASSFGESYAEGGRGGVQMGSPPSEGCWSRSLDSPSTSASPSGLGGFLEQGDPYFIGSRRLSADPTTTTIVAPSTTLQNTSFSPIFVPNRLTEWYVCYRRTCLDEMAKSGSKACKEHSGFRVLPFHSTTKGGLPSKWVNLEDSYTPGLATTYSHKFIPDHYDSRKDFRGDGQVGYPPELTWYMNDTTIGTWGPLVVEQQNRTEALSIDSRPWNYWTAFSGYSEKKVTSAEGSAVRVVRTTKPCSYHDIIGDSAESTDGGMVECIGSSATTDTTLCKGSSHDAQRTHQVAYYLTLPQTVATYRVCVRIGFFNWREISASPASGQRLDASDAMPISVLQRNGWVPPSALTTTDTWLASLTLQRSEARAGMSALFIISDTSGAQNLAAAPLTTTSAGDIVRIAPLAEGCDMHPGRTQLGTHADFFLSLYCAKGGGGGTSESGLLTTASPSVDEAVCQSAANTKRICGEQPCGSSDALFERYLAATPEGYDDVVPGYEMLHGVGSLAAEVVLPAVGEYKICYKSVSSPNWAVLNGSFITAEAPGYVVSPAGGSDLVSGSFKKFEVNLKSTSFPSNTTQFYAKFARFDTTYESIPQGNAVCHFESAGTEAGEYGSATKVFHYIEDVFTFYLNVPSAPGRYVLCLQIRKDELDDPRSWWVEEVAAVPQTYAVIDNGVRWYAVNGNAPTNQGNTAVNFVRCAPTMGVCDFASSQHVFNTTENGDAAKIVSWNASCRDPLPDAFENDDSIEASSHIGIERDAGVLGITNLGPADGPSDIAQITVILPDTPNDEQTQYKICVKTMVLSTPIWVEAIQKKDTRYLQVTNTFLQSDGQNRSAFYTTAALIKSWQLSDALTATHSTYTAPLSNTVVSGISTTYVSNNDALSASVPATIGYGFAFTTYGGEHNVSESFFKMVVAAEPEASGEWTPRSSDCFSPAAGTASNIEDCEHSDTAFCPHLVDEGSTVQAVFDMPLLAGKYRVCYKANVSSTDSLLNPRPWIWLSSASSDRYLYTHPAGLSYSVSSAGSNISVYDTNIADSSTPLSSWCAPKNGTMGAPCFDSAGQFHDMISVVNSTLVCPSRGDTLWHNLTRANNATSVLSGYETAFVLPPKYPSLSGQYKICVYKAGEIEGDESSGLKRGRVYQVAGEGGEDFWREESGMGQPSRLIVESSVVYNGTLRFTEYSSEVAQRYRGVSTSLLTDPATGLVKRTPLIASGSTITYTVKIASPDGSIVPLSNIPIEVMRCDTSYSWEGVQCSSGSNAPHIVPGFFSVHSIEGACNATDAVQHGWPSNGLTQFSAGGYSTFRLQYRSACPRGEFGCGIRFVGRTLEGVELWSAALWVSVKEDYPNGVALDDAVTIDESINTLTKKCTHNTQCDLHLTAELDGSSEFAPLGQISIEYSTPHYGATPNGIPSDVMSTLGASLGVAPLVTSADWQMGGKFVYKFAPKLLPGIEAATGYLTVYYGENLMKSVQVRIDVSKTYINTVRVDSITPADIRLGLINNERQRPSPAISLNVSSTSGGTYIGVSPTDYIEALRPYDVHFSLLDVNGVATPPAGLLWGKTLTAEILEYSSGISSASRVNKVIGLPETLEGYMVTEPSYIAAQSFEAAFLNEISRISFRVFVLNGACSRFNPQGGCTVRFTLNPIAVQFHLTTPIRVPAASIKVTPSVATASVAEGVYVVAMPGTFVVGEADVAGFIPDEFHEGDLFVLFRETDGLYGDGQSVDGVFIEGDSEDLPCVYTTPDGECSTHGHSSGHIDSGWGVNFTLRTTAPCYSCEVGVYSTAGASPVSFLPASKQAEVGSNEIDFTLTENPTTIRCTIEDPIILLDHHTGNLSIKIEAGIADTDNITEYANWLTYIDPLEDISFNSFSGMQNSSEVVSIHHVYSPYDASVLSSTMIEGIAEYHLSVDATKLNVTSEEPMGITFHVVKRRYGVDSDSFEGSTEMRSCNVDVVLKQKPQSSSIFATAVIGGAVPLCEEETPLCTSFSTTIDSFGSEGVTIALSIWNMTDGVTNPDSTPRNVTVVASTECSWMLDTFSENWVSSIITMPSLYNPSPLPTKDGKTYSFGSLNVTATRKTYDESFNTVVAGRSSVSLTYGGSGDKPPVRKAEFKICATTWQGGAEVVDSALCTQVYLWIAQSGVSQAVLWEEPSVSTTSALSGASEDCGGGALQFTAFSYQTFSTVLDASQRFISYDVDQAFVLSVQGQSLGAITIEQDRDLTTDLSFTENMAVFTLYNAEVRANATVVLSNAQSTVRSKGLYSWVLPTETAERFTLLDHVTYDDSCPTTRTLPITHQNYRTSSKNAPPGEGWGYSGGVSTFTRTPFQAVVQNGDNETTRSFATTLMKVSKLTLGACNDGGALYVFGTSDAQNLSITTPLSFTNYHSRVVTPHPTPTPTEGAVQVKRGVATAWVVFTAPCQKCALQFDLCYAGASLEDCFEPGPTSDAPPMLPRRSVISRPFSVAEPELSGVHVFNQSIEDEIVVGRAVSVSFEAYEGFAGWAVAEQKYNRKWTTHVTITTRLASNTANPVKYGRGGFLSRDHSDVMCGYSVSKSAFASSAYSQRFAVDQNNPEVRFSFTRPCVKCELWVAYTLTPPNPSQYDAKSGVFPLREYTMEGPDDILAIEVTTCGTAWVLVGPPLVAVRKRRDFTLSVVHVDSNGMPGRGYAEEDVVDPILSASGFFGAGNGGGGGAPVVTSPVVERNPVRFRSNGGAGTVRMHYKRSCYRCVGSVMGNSFEVSVLNDATRLIAVPAYNDKDQTMHVDVANQIGEWQYEIYAADEFGDRSYTLGGPTMYAMQAPYCHFSEAYLSATKLSVKPGSDVTIPSVLQDEKYVLHSLRLGRPQVRVVNGSAVYNGIPTLGGGDGGGRAGVATVQVVANTPAADLEVSFALSSGEDLPTHFYGTEDTPVVQLSCTALRMSLASLPAVYPTGEGLRECGSTGMSIETEYCYLDAFLIGRAPEGSSGTPAEWFLANQAFEGTAKLDISCAEDCGSVEHPAEAAFFEGRARLYLKLAKFLSDSTECSCTATVTPPESLLELEATPQRLTIVYNRATATGWRWERSHDVFFTRTRSGVVFEDVNTVVNRTVHLGLVLTDARGDHVEGDDDLQWSAKNDTETTTSLFTAAVNLSSSGTTPRGCFQCTQYTTDGQCILHITKYGYAQLPGTFTQMGACTILPSAISGLPGPTGSTSPETGLRVTVSTPKNISSVGFDGLSGNAVLRENGVVSGSSEAAICGLGTELEVHVVDVNGDLVTGENQMVFQAVGFTKVRGKVWRMEEVITEGGIAVFELEASETTRICSGEGCEQNHDPWYFNVTAYRFNESSPSEEVFQTLTYLGPLYFVKQAAHLAVILATRIPCSNQEWLYTPPCPPIHKDSTALERFLYQGALTGSIPLPGSIPSGSKAGVLPYAPFHEMNGYLFEGSGGRLGPHPARYGYGYNLSLEIIAVGYDGEQIKDKDDQGASATIRFSPLSIPCQNVDNKNSGRFHETTCIIGGSCEVFGQNECDPQESSGWAMPTKFTLTNGYKKLENIQYGVSPVASPGVTRFALTTTGFGYGGEQRTDEGDEEEDEDEEDAKHRVHFPFEVLFQSPAGVRPVLGPVDCDFEDQTLSYVLFSLVRCNQKVRFSKNSLYFLGGKKWLLFFQTIPTQMPLRHRRCARTAPLPHSSSFGRRPTAYHPYRHRQHH